MSGNAAAAPAARAARSLRRRLLDNAALLVEALHLSDAPQALQLVRALRAAGRSLGEVEVTPPGGAAPLRLRGRSSDAATFVQIFLRAELEFPLARPPQVIVDGGANIGCATVYFAHRFPQARIIAVEFEPGNFARLVRNTARLTNVCCVQAALWSSEGTMRVANPGAASWAYYPEPESRGSADGVRALTVPTLMREQQIDRIDLLKLDIEGSEYEVFGAATDWLEHTGAIAIELHDHLRPGAARRFWRALEPYDFRMSSRGEYVVVDQLARAAAGSRRARA